MSSAIVRCKTCEHCGREFAKNPEYSYAVWETVRFCYRKCMGAARSKTVRTCRHCSSEYHPSHLDRPYCSQACYWNDLRVVRFPLRTRGSDLFSRPMKRELLRLYDGRCAACGSTEHLEFDHRIPRFLGGRGTIDNGQVLCRDCHKEKTLRERLDHEA